MAQTFDPYRALGVRRDATDTDVKAAHRKLAKRFHPDTEGGDRDKFLRVQEAYKVLSDPLLRREWDTRYAPGPVRADRSAAPSPTARPRTTQRRPARPAAAPAEQASADADPAESAESAARQPRTSRAYTWSAADVPWWEESVSENRRQPGRKRPARPKSTTQAGAAEPPQSPAAAHAEQTNPFDVYNRSSGAAWSMAARAYFRRGDQELPRRGQFQYEGTQVLTGARSRAYTEAEARRRAAQASRPQPTAATPATAAAASAATAAAPGAAAFTYTASGVSHDAHRIHEVRQTWRKRTSAAAWPSLKERLLYALLAWIPAAIVIGYSGAAVTGCEPTLNDCPAYLETAQAIAIALALGLLVALPKIAYIGAMAAIGAFIFGLVLVGILAVSGAVLPLSKELIGLLAITLGLAYAATVGIVLVRSPDTRPWFAGAEAAS